LIIGNFASLWEAAHALVDERHKVVVFHDGIRDDADGDMHVLVVVHRGAEVEVLDIACHIPCFRSGENAVEVNLEGGLVSCFGADVAAIVDLIATNGEANTARILLFRMKGCNNTQVRYHFAAWHLGDGDEEHRVSTGGHRGMALAKAADFNCTGCYPERTLTAVAKLRILGDLPRVGVECIAMECEVLRME